MPATRLMSKAAVAYKRDVDLKTDLSGKHIARAYAEQMASYRTRHHWFRWVDPTSVLLGCSCCGIQPLLRISMSPPTHFPGRSFLQALGARAIGNKAERGVSMSTLSSRNMPTMYTIFPT